MSANLCDALATDDVDLVDLQTVSPELAETIFEQGVLLVSEQEHTTDVRNQLTAPESTDRSPRERFDAAIARIDEHLGGAVVTATDDEARER